MNYLTASFNDFEALNLTDFEAGISIFSPVAGFNPIRAALSRV